MAHGAAGLAAFALLRAAPTAAAGQIDTPDTAEERLLRRQEVIDALMAGGSLWSATSPATHSGDTYRAVLTNRSASTRSVWISAIIMDHQAHHNELVVDERFEIAPEEERTLEATNGYGSANHFSTRLIVDSGNPDEFGVEITIADQTGVQTTSFNERAFWIKSAGDVLTRAGQHEHEEEAKEA
jgi:hypothetical protein